MLANGTTIKGTAGGVFTIISELGAGGQGAVYKARDAAGRDVAVKWYFNLPNRPDRRHIEDLARRGAPSKQFLWPQEVVQSGADFGYVMGLRPQGFADVPSLLKRKVKPKLSTLARAAIEIASAFRKLQEKGLFYCDISEGNLFFSVETGEVLICDNDNVSSSGQLPGVLGTARYMAPEIVRGEANPSANTDIHAMAVLLFLLLFNDHPLQGANEAKIRAFDAAAMDYLYGKNPVFIFDPNDTQNRPVPGVGDNAVAYWDLYPHAARPMFIKTFTDGIKDPARRPAFQEWMRGLTSIEDGVLECSCGKQNFFEPSEPDRRCWGPSCKRPLGSPMRILIGKNRTVVLNTDTKIFPHHLNPLLDAGVRGAHIAEITPHPTNGTFGLRNTSTQHWYVTDYPANGSDPTVHTVETGRAIGLRDRLEIDFGGTRGVVSC
ncbi:MAG: serine/threonine protein kinase [Actinomycetes bacterium]